MRYYDIGIFTNPELSNKRKTAIKGDFKDIYGSDLNKDVFYRRFSSHYKGIPDPGALRVAFDFQKYGAATPAGDCRISIWGISPADMNNAVKEMVGMRLVLEVGMGEGLPLAVYGRRGLVLDSVIQKVIGNWEGTELRLDIYVMSNKLAEEFTNSANITLPWRKGVRLDVALTNCFQRLDGYKFKIDISDKLINDYDDSLYTGKLYELAKRLYAISKKIIKDKKYPGITVTLEGKFIRVFDGTIKDGDIKNRTNQQKSIPINPASLVGLPTWSGVFTLNAAVVMRGDLKIGDWILLPKDIQPNVANSFNSEYLNDEALGTRDNPLPVQIRGVRYIGDSRSPDASQWITVLDVTTSAGSG